MKIRITNINNPKLHPGEVLVLINRQTPVGNPWFIGSNTSAKHRNDVCNKYEEYFNRMLLDSETSDTLSKHYGFKVDKTKFMKYLRHIYKLSKKYDIVLGCHCYPLRCHGETIKKYIESLLREDDMCDGNQD